MLSTSDTTDQGEVGSVRPYPGSFVRTRRRVAWLVLAGLLVLAPLAVVVSFAVRDPPSTLAAIAAREGRVMDQTVVPLDQISPDFARAVILSEDARYCLHWGIDLAQLQIVLRDLSEGGRVRGASTITMQVVKNTLLWPEPSYVRKALEIPLAAFLDLVLSKDRILEIYLNVAQTGPRTLGAEAGARHHFGVSAQGMSGRQARLMAAALPSPAVRNPNRPGRRQAAQATRVARELPGSDWLFTCLDLD